MACLTEILEELIPALPFVNFMTFVILASQQHSSRDAML